MKIRKLIIMTILIGGILPTHGWADGNKLLLQCQDVVRVLGGENPRDAYDVGYCVGKVTGVRDTLYLIQDSNSPINVCFPENNISTPQAVRVVAQYLSNNPSKLHENGLGLIIMAYVEAFPCE